MARNWRLAKSKHVPAGAFMTGRQNDGAFWTAVAHTEYGDIPGKAKGDTCWYAYGGKEEVTHQFSWVVSIWDLCREENGEEAPMDAIPAGTQNDYWVAVAHTEHGNIPGKAKINSCWYSYDGKEETTDHFYWVVAHEWKLKKREKGGEPPSNAINSGNQNDGVGEFWVAIAHTEHGDIPGKAKDDTCWYTYKGKEEKTHHFSWIIAMNGSEKFEDEKVDVKITKIDEPKLGEDKVDNQSKTLVLNTGDQVKIGITQKDKIEVAIEHTKSDDVEPGEVGVFPRLIRITDEAKTINTDWVPCKSSSINKSDSFILDSKDKIFQYNGGASMKVKNRTSTITKAIIDERSIHKKIDKEVIDLGTEKWTPEFWKILGGAPEHIPKDHKDVPVHPPQLFLVSDDGGDMKFEMIAQGSKIKKKSLKI